MTEAHTSSRVEIFLTGRERDMLLELFLMKLGKEGGRWSLNSVDA